jgi:hypothetical protein
MRTKITIPLISFSAANEKSYSLFPGTISLSLAKHISYLLIIKSVQQKVTLNFNDDSQKVPIGSWTI